MLQQLMAAFLAANLPVTGLSSSGFDIEADSHLIQWQGTTYRVDLAEDYTEEDIAAIEAIAASFVPQDPQESTAEKVEKLEGKLRNTAFWAHLWGAMISNVRANGCVSFLMIALTNTRNPDDLVFGFNQLRLAMQTEPGLQDFSPALLDFLGSTLADLNLELPGLNLAIQES